MSGLLVDTRLIATTNSIGHFLLGQSFGGLELSINFTTVLHFLSMEVKQTRFVQTESNLDFSIKGNTCRQGQLGSTDFLTKFGVNFFVRSRSALLLTKKLTPNLVRKSVLPS